MYELVRRRPTFWHRVNLFVLLKSLESQNMTVSQIVDRFRGYRCKKSTRTNFPRIFQNLVSNCHRWLSFHIPKSFISLLKTSLIWHKIAQNGKKTRFFRGKKNRFPASDSHCAKSKCLPGIVLHSISYPPNLLSKTP